MKLRKKILLMITAIIATTLVALGVYVTSAFNFSTNELAKTFKDYNTSDSEAIKQTKPISILLMGVDTGDSERKSTWQGNSDSMILVTINPETKTTTMTSLERDVLVTLSGPKDNDMTGVQAKLNTAYASGGAKMAIMTVQDLLDIEIDNYIQINMQGLVDLVDAVGGITVTNNFDFPISIAEKEPEYTATVEPGTHKINGEQALVYARMRYDDPEGDYGRQKRQREVIQKVMKKILALDSVSSYKKILSAVSGNMQTNIEISSSTIPSLLGYTDALSNVETYQLQGEGEMINGTSYEIVSADHLLEIQNNIKKQLGQKESDTLKTTTVLSEDLYGTYDSSYSSGYDTTYSDGYNSNYYYDDYSSSTYSDYYGSTDTYSQSYNSYSY
ncbi:biofilm formation/cell division transcriptional regulator BrpA [Streptococcus alactolyticus]|uniref:glycopolymer--peptidoglycan transferase LytR n=1 Tax=Streptococcus alactolyticus TaxID=29389 RepID=UPI001F3FB284|nr:LCP family protein [Streptococcus alactolyticus]MCF2666820.1 LCP family protein [Streptococcus alactolyticus]MCF2678856.1 LCP family protein [Streptococcus alactolyticus]MDY5187465.1 LCP family protein [Streptococcus alactolyticus]